MEEEVEQLYQYKSRLLKYLGRGMITQERYDRLCDWAESEISKISNEFINQ